MADLRVGGGGGGVEALTNLKRRHIGAFDDPNHDRPNRVHVLVKLVIDSHQQLVVDRHHVAGLGAWVDGVMGRSGPGCRYCCYAPLLPNIKLPGFPWLWRRW